MAKAYTYYSLTRDRSVILYFDNQVAYFYSENKKLPQSKKELISFLELKGDELYYNALTETGFNFRFDSSEYSVLLYNNGLDWNDDNCEFLYDPSEIDFLKSLFINGDVLFCEFNPKKKIEPREEFFPTE